VAKARRNAGAAAIKRTTKRTTERKKEKSEKKN